MPLRTATNAVRRFFRQWKFGKTMEKQGDSYEIIVCTNLCDRSITGLKPEILILMNIIIIKHEFLKK